MARFYFHVLSGDEALDHEGVDLPDAEAARREAIKYAGAMLADSPDLLADSMLAVQVTDGRDDPLFTLTVTLAPGSPWGKPGGVQGGFPGGNPGSSLDDYGPRTY